jgi:hypothetical protein
MKEESLIVYSRSMLVIDCLIFDFIYQILTCNRLLSLHLIHYVIQSTPDSEARRVGISVLGYVVFYIYNI